METPKTPAALNNDLSDPTKPEEIIFWQPPPEDFEEWRRFTQDERADSYKNYLDILDMLQTRVTTDGIPNDRVHASVATLKAKLAELGIENTPDNRSYALRLL